MPANKSQSGNEKRDAEAFFATQAEHVEQCAKETRVVLAIWLVALITIVTVMVSLGYVAPEDRPDVPILIWGVPSWVFWGLFVPWFVLIAVSWWFAIGYLKDDEPLHELPDATSDSAR